MLFFNWPEVRVPKGLIPYIFDVNDFTLASFLSDSWKERHAEGRTKKIVKEKNGSP